MPAVRRRQSGSVMVQKPPVRGLPQVLENDRARFPFDHPSHERRSAPLAIIRPIVGTPAEYEIAWSVEDDVDSILRSGPPRQGSPAYTVG